MYKRQALDYNVFVTFLQAFLIVSVTAIANWAVCTLMQGKGRLIDIFCTLAYGLLPYIFSQLLYVILSRACLLYTSTFGCPFQDMFITAC